MSLLFKEFIVLTIQGIYCPYYSRNLVSLLFYIVLTIQGIWCPYYSRNLLSLLFKEFSVPTILYCPYYSRTSLTIKNYIMTVLTVAHDSVAVQLKVIYFLSL